MNTILSSLETAFFNMMSFSQFEPFMILVLFGITLQLKDWKPYLSLLLAITVGSTIGLLLCNLDIINFSISTVKLTLAFAILLIGIQNLLINGNSNSTIRYNIFAILGLILGIGINMHYSKIYGTEFSLYPFLGYNLGAVISYLAISFTSLLLSSLGMILFKTDRRSFNLVVSGIGIGIALVLIYIRY